MKNINIIYLLPEMKGASGGAKVIYKHSTILNSLDKNVSSSVNHLKKKLVIKLQLHCQKDLNFLNNKTLAGKEKK